MSRDIKEKVYRYVREKIMEGFPPSVREVQDEFGFKSSGSARAHIDDLVEAGRLVRLTGLSRGLKLPDGDIEFHPEVMVPMMGTVRAGLPELAHEEPYEHIPVRTSFPAKDLFALKVRGESMTGVGIFPRDIVIVRKQPEAQSGQIVVAFLGDEVTIKTLRIKKGQQELHPENSDYPILLPTHRKELRIIGIVVEVRRTVVPPP